MSKCYAILNRMPNGGLRFLKQDNSKRTEYKCCKCFKQVSIFGDARCIAASEKCKQCENYVHQDCKEKKDIRCLPVAPVGFPVKGCKCNRTQCFVDCLENFCKIDLGENK